jgi:hypothetical protein
VARYFTVDRTSTLHPGLVFDRQEIALDPPEMQQFARDLFPDGVTRHGWQYFVNPVQLLAPGGANASFISDFAFELVRRSYAPHRPSRYTSVFGWGSVEDAVAFRTTFCAGQGSVWELDGPAEAFRADMRCLNIGGTSLSTWYLACRYWDGEPNDANAEPMWEYLLELPVTVVDRVEV